VNRRAPGGGLLHPVPLAAIVLLILNDHLLKSLYRGAVTGKLSDLAGLAFFPLFLQGLLELCGLRRSDRLLRACVASTALVFTAVKTLPAALYAYRFGLGALQWPLRALLAALHGAPPPDFAPVAGVLDPTDLMALPMLALAYRVRPPGGATGAQNSVVA